MFAVRSSKINRDLDRNRGPKLRLFYLAEKGTETMRQSVVKQFTSIV